VKTLQLGPEDVGQVSKILSNGGIVALPTETVYGLAGNAFSSECALKIFRAKERPSFDPLITHVSEALLSKPGGVLKALVEAGVIDAVTLTWNSAPVIERLLHRFWPGPLTLILPRGSNIPDEVTSGSPRVGVRMPAHPLFQKVLNLTGFPLAAPSANRFGRISPTTAAHVIAELDGRIDAILDGGPCRVGVESTIVSIEELPEQGLTATLLRPGQVSRSELESSLGVAVGDGVGLGEKNQKISAPGMLDQHYAPSKPLYLYPGVFPSREVLDAWIAQQGPDKTPAFLCQNLKSTRNLRVGDCQRVLTPESDPEAAARTLFSTLRALDEDVTVDFIVAELPENTSEGLGAAIADRLNRASVNKPLLRR
jgi:L-threonylcarbamoyladenylate synthase